MKTDSLPSGAWESLFPRALALIDEISKYGGMADPFWTLGGGSLDVVKVFRQLFVAVDFFAHDVGDDFLAGRAHAEIAVMTVFQAQQFFTVKFPAAGFLPQLGRLHHRHQQLHAACARHFFAHDVFDFA